MMVHPSKYFPVNRVRAAYFIPVYHIHIVTEFINKQRKFLRVILGIAICIEYKVIFCVIKTAF